MSLQPGNKIEEMFAFTAVDPANNIEGVISIHSPLLGNLPAVGADMERVESLRPLAEEAARASGAKVKLVRFSQREVLEEFG